MTPAVYSCYEVLTSTDDSLMKMIITMSLRFLTRRCSVYQKVGQYHIAATGRAPKE
jgi:hypothetical protein